MDVQGVPPRQIVTVLPDRLEERQTFDIADRTADLARTKLKPSLPSWTKSLMALVTCGIT